MTENTNTRVRRSPAEILAAKEAEIVSARSRAAVDAQMSHPSVQRITEILTGNAKARTDAKKGYNGNPNQTFANRIQSHSLWISVIEAEKAVADAEIALCDHVSPLYRALRNEVATALANGQDVSEMVANGEKAIKEGAKDLEIELSSATGMLAIATEARKAVVLSKKTPQAQALATV